MDVAGDVEGVPGGGGGAGGGVDNGLRAVVDNDAAAEDSSSSGVMHVRIISSQPLQVPLREYDVAAGAEESGVNYDASTAVNTESEEKVGVERVRRTRAASAAKSARDAASVTQARSSSRARGRSNSSGKPQDKPPFR